MVRGPCQDIPSTSPEDRGRRLFSTDDTMPSLRPLACLRKKKRNTKRLAPYCSVSSERYNCSNFTLKYISKTIFISVVCIRPHPLLFAYKGSMGGRLSFIHRRLCPDPTRTEFHQCQKFLSKTSSRLRKGSRLFTNNRTYNDIYYPWPTMAELKIYGL